MHGDVATGPQHAVEFANKELERLEKLVVVFRVAHVFELVRVGVELSEGWREYAEAD